jgi:hypothetical protein
MTHKTVYYVNRNRYNRKRHVDPDCRALKRARQSLDEMHADGFYDGFEEAEGEPPPTQETRFVAATPRDAEELRARDVHLPLSHQRPRCAGVVVSVPVDFE